MDAKLAAAPHVLLWGFQLLPGSTPTYLCQAQASKAGIQYSSAGERAEPGRASLGSNPDTSLCCVILGEYQNSGGGGMGLGTVPNIQ